MNTLVIVESPAKCKKIESYLGQGYKVIASFGHLRHVANLASIDINNNFHTKYDIIQEELKLKQVEKIRNEITKSNEVIIATDDDREGESIGWHICDIFNLSIVNTKRIIFHEITETAIRTAVANPTRINMSVVFAQQSRQILDMLVGYTISPILWNVVNNSSLSAGRCQTPALRLIYDNYLDIKKSPGKMVYNTVGYFTNLNLPFDLNKQFISTPEVVNFLEQCKQWEFICNITAPKKVIKKSPEPLTTSTLQQLASNELHMSPKETMKRAQELYENGLITYMRTDSKKYSQEFITTVKQYITANHGEQYISQAIDHLSIKTDDNNDKTKNANDKNKNDKNKIQEAHEAIRPVNINVMDCNNENNQLESKTKKLYQLIWQKTLESCMPSAQYNSVSAGLTAPCNAEFIYKTEQPIFLGWQIISSGKKELKEVEEVAEVAEKKGIKEKETNKTETNTNNKHYQYITALKPNVSLILKKIDAKFSLSELKSHYTEARLVQLLEEQGIGRPSTFASLVDKIQERKYVEKQTIEGRELEYNDCCLVANEITETTVKRTFGNEKTN